MRKSSTYALWILWLSGSLAAAVYLGYALVAKADRQVLMPGPLSAGHHQFAAACEVCHTEPLGGGELLQQACVDCHGEVRKKPFDSHPAAKFKDPRNADRLEKIDALHCVTCHTEHRPEITLVDGLTQPRDLCANCHQDVAEDRPSHQGMAFTTCKNSGCHNFHNNRALYTDFLVKHLHEAPTKADGALPARAFAGLVDQLPDYPHERYPSKPLGIADMDAPATAQVTPAIQRDWLETAHAKAGVNCSGCHQPPDAEGQPRAWSDHPGSAGCAQCHGLESKRFGEGKHGMRLAAGLSPMTPAQARLPMKDKAAHRQLTCLSCHGAHRFDVAKAAVQACVGCHDDKHTLAYADSPHARLWRQARAGEIPAERGVSCASCHMPRIDYDVNDWISRVMVDHNQSADLSPNSKMIRPACLHCHGLGFSIDALADRALIDRNFSGQPQVHVDTMELAEKDQQRRREESGGDDAGMFGF
jgi:formate-dependent nitrite reductase cytochrome c552 subunit